MRCVIHRDAAFTDTRVTLDKPVRQTAPLRLLCCSSACPRARCGKPGTCTSAFQGARCWLHGCTTVQTWWSPHTKWPQQLIKRGQQVWRVASWKKTEMSRMAFNTAVKRGWRRPSRAAAGAVLERALSATTRSHSSRAARGSGGRRGVEAGRAERRRRLPLLLAQVLHPSRGGGFEDRGGRVCSEGEV
jgi:hypothetical protein